MPNRHNRIAQPIDTSDSNSPDVVLQLLGDIHEQNQMMMTKFDALESTVTRRAQAAGAMSGAFTGGVGGAVVTIGIELIKAKFGG